MAIDTNETKDSLFGNFKKISKPSPFSKEVKTDSETGQEIEDVSVFPATGKSAAAKLLPVNLAGSEIMPKWQSFDKVTALLTSDQKNGLDQIAKKLMKYRSRELKGIEEKERITANTIIRALIENFLKVENFIDLEVLSSEADVLEWVKKAFKTH